LDAGFLKRVVQSFLNVPKSFRLLEIPVTLPMEALDLEPQISGDRRGVLFTLTSKSGPVECMILRVAMESYFWLPLDADDSKILRTFHDGSRRIQAIAYRKLLAHPASRLELTAADFARG
jgi:hypothetical protein